MTTWVSDTNGNKCSDDYFGSVEAAQAALDSLKLCRGCINCSRCTGCTGCSGCSRCSYCSYCSRCSGCSRCSDCSGCSGCSDKNRLAADLRAPSVPIIANIHQAVYAAVTAPDATLDMSSWHKCGTTHCRAGWVVHLAGEAGYALERYHNTALAAQLIYRESGAPINPSRFYDSDEDALADMKQLAEETAAD